MTATGGCRLFCSALPVRSTCLAATHLSSPEIGNGLSWPKPPCACNAIWLLAMQAQHSTNEGVLRSNSACSMLMSDDLRLPRRGIEPRPSGFRDIGSTSRPSPLPYSLIYLAYLFIRSLTPESLTPNKSLINAEIILSKFSIVHFYRIDHSLLNRSFNQSILNRAFTLKWLTPKSLTYLLLNRLFRFKSLTHS